MGETTAANGADSLRQALSTAQAGTTIELAPGNYGELRISVPYGDPWGSFSGEVTIRSADADDPATFSSVYLNEVRNLTFDGIAVDYTTPAGLAGNKIQDDIAFLVRDSANVTVRNSVFEGDLLDDPGSAYDDLPVAIGISARSSQGVVVEDNEFLNWKRGGTFANESSDITVRGNDVHTIRSDGFNFSSVQDVLIEGNTFHDFVTADGVGDHRDMIQFHTAGTSTPSTGIVIRDNVFNSGGGTETQSIFMRNEAVDGSENGGPAMFYRDIAITNNVIYNAHLHGITVGETDGLTIAGNTLLHNVDSGDAGTVSLPRINVAEDARHVTVADNISHAVPEPADASWDVAHNLLVQDLRPGEANYYGDLFINALTGGGEADLAALQAIPGGAVEKGGYGASLTRFDAKPDSLTAVIHPEGETDGVFGFDAGYSANAQGRLGAGDASFRWDMGDGTVLDGAEVEHDFAPGTYTVRLTVTDADGNTDTALTETYVSEPVRLDLDVTSKGLVDLSSFGGAPLPSVEVAKDDDHGYAVRLTDKTGFQLDRGVAPIYDLDAFTVSLDLKAADGTASAGEVFRLHQNMVLKVGETGGFSFELTNAAGETFDLHTAPTDALDGDWHTVSVSYEKSSGDLALALDGAEAGSTEASGFTKPVEYWGLNFGSIWGKTGFDGLIDTVEISDEPLPGGRGGSVSPPEAPESPADNPADNPAADPADGAADDPADGAADGPADGAADGADSGSVIYRWNAGTSTIAATDGGPDWVADAGVITASARLASHPSDSWTLDASVPATTPTELFVEEYWGNGSSMALEFGDGGLEDGRYAVRLYMGNGWTGTSEPGERVFDVEIEDQLVFEDVDLSDTLGHLVGGMFEWTGQVADGTIDIDFEYVVENPLIDGVEIVRLDGDMLA